MFVKRLLVKLLLGVSFLLLAPQSAFAGCGSVVLDAGHGGGDSGAVGPTGFMEKTANLDIALRARDLLVGSGYHVIMTRTTDVSPNSPAQDLTGDGQINVSDDLQARVNIANNARAKVFVSVHNNAAGSAARGTETYYWNGAPAGSGSARLAQLIHEEVNARIGLYDRGVKTANFYVLRRTNMPAVLLEGAFISNPTEELLLSTPSFRQKIAEGVANGIRRYMGPGGPGPDKISLKVKPGRRARIDLNRYFCDRSIGARVTADVPVMAERTMYFDSGGINGVSGGRGAKGPGRAWYLAEGFTGTGFDTWLLLANPTDLATAATIKYMTSTGIVDGPQVKLPPRSRRSVHVNKTLPNRSFATKVTSSGKIVVERSMYFKNATHNGGHSSIGAQKPATRWYFAEGRTGPQFDTWLLLFNPTKATAHVDLTYIGTAGEIGARRVEIAPETRQSVLVDNDIADTDVSAIATSDVPIVVERSVYFNLSGISGGHNTVGAVSPSRNWYFADGSTKSGYTEFLTIQNPNNVATALTVYYMTGKGDVFSNVKVVPARSRGTIWVADAGEAGPGKSIAMRLTAELPVVAERSMYVNVNGFNGGSASIGSMSLSRRWLFAEGFTGQGFKTSIMVSNPNDVEATIKVRFFKE